MTQSLTLAEEPPSSAPVSQDASFPAQNFGYDSHRYWLFLEALVEGLFAYDLQQSGGDHAATPLPAA
jgi:hypothetical protein